MSWQVASFAVIGGVLVGGFAWYERSKPPSQVIALVAALAALAVLGRLLFAPLPNVKPTTDIVIFSGYALGAAPGFAVGALAALISNFWLGQGPWTPWQMAGWGIAGILGAWLARARGGRVGRIELALACGLVGIAYGALLNFSLMVSYGGEVSFERFALLQGRAVPFDAAHALGNVTFALIAGPAMVRMLVRFRERFEFRWRPGVAAKAGSAAAIAALAFTVGGLAPAPTDAAPQVPAASWLERAQNRNGGFAAEPGEESSPEMTGWAMLGLAASGRNPRDVRRNGNSAVDYLRRNAGELRTPGDLARTILSLKAAGVSARDFAGRDLIARLAGRQRANGSFQGWPNSTAFAVLALRASGAPGVGRALAWLRRVQNGDGGWSAVPSVASDPDSTGAVLQAVRSSRAGRVGVQYLRRTQKANGGWALVAGSAANAQSTAWAVQGLVAAGADPTRIRKGRRTGLDFLASRVAADGHYRYSATSDQTPVWVTGQALAAAHLKPFPLAAVPRKAESSSASRGGGATGPPPSLAGRASGGADRPPAERRATAQNAREGPGAALPGMQGRHGDDPGLKQPTPSVASREVAVREGGASNGGDGDEPLLAAVIGAGLGALLFGGGWWGARRLSS